MVYQKFQICRAQHIITMLDECIPHVGDYYLRHWGLYQKGLESDVLRPKKMMYVILTAP